MAWQSLIPEVFRSSKQFFVTTGFAFVSAALVTGLSAAGLYFSGNAMEKAIHNLAIHLRIADGMFGLGGSPDNPHLAQRIATGIGNPQLALFMIWFVTAWVGKAAVAKTVVATYFADYPEWLDARRVEKELEGRRAMPFIGREAQLAALQQMDDADRLLASIHGLAGCGKSRLALEWALIGGGERWVQAGDGWLRRGEPAQRTRLSRIRPWVRSHFPWLGWLVGRPRPDDPWDLGYLRPQFVNAATSLAAMKTRRHTIVLVDQASPGTLEQLRALLRDHEPSRHRSLTFLWVDQLPLGASAGSNNIPEGAQPFSIACPRLSRDEVARFSTAAGLELDEAVLDLLDRESGGIPLVLRWLVEALLAGRPLLDATAAGLLQEKEEAWLAQFHAAHVAAGGGGAAPARLLLATAEVLGGLPRDKLDMAGWAMGLSIADMPTHDTLKRLFPDIAPEQDMPGHPVPLLGYAVVFRTLLNLPATAEVLAARGWAGRPAAMAAALRGMWANRGILTAMPAAQPGGEAFLRRMLDAMLAVPAARSEAALSSWSALCVALWEEGLREPDLLRHLHAAAEAEPQRAELQNAAAWALLVAAQHAEPASREQHAALVARWEALRNRPGTENWAPVLASILASLQSGLSTDAAEADGALRQAAAALDKVDGQYRNFAGFFLARGYARAAQLAHDARGVTPDMRAGWLRDGLRLAQAMEDRPEATDWSATLACGIVVRAIGMLVGWPGVVPRSDRTELYVSGAAALQARIADAPMTAWPPSLLCTLADAAAEHVAGAAEIPDARTYAARRQALECAHVLVTRGRREAGSRLTGSDLALLLGASLRAFSHAARNDPDNSKSHLDGSAPWVDESHALLAAAAPEARYSLARDLAFRSLAIGDTLLFFERTFQAVPAERWLGEARSIAEALDAMALGHCGGDDRLFEPATLAWAGVAQGAMAQVRYREQLDPPSGAHARELARQATARCNRIVCEASGHSEEAVLKFNAALAHRSLLRAECSIGGNDPFRPVRVEPALEGLRAARGHLVALADLTAGDGRSEIHHHGLLLSARQVLAQRLTFLATHFHPVGAWSAEQRRATLQEALQQLRTLYQELSQGAAAGFEHSQRALSLLHAMAEAGARAAGLECFDSSERERYLAVAIDAREQLWAMEPGDLDEKLRWGTQAIFVANEVVFGAAWLAAGARDVGGAQREALLDAARSCNADIKAILASAGAEDRALSALPQSVRRLAHGAAYIAATAKDLDASRRLMLMEEAREHLRTLVSVEEQAPSPSLGQVTLEMRALAARDICGALLQINDWPRFSADEQEALLTIGRTAAAGLDRRLANLRRPDPQAAMLWVLLVESWFALIVAYNRAGRPEWANGATGHCLRIVEENPHIPGLKDAWLRLTGPGPGPSPETVTRQGTDTATPGAP